MLNAIFTMMVLGCAFWVYFDATDEKIGRIPNEGGMFNMSAGAWAAVTLGLWIIGFPAYIVKRRSLIEKAKSKPVEVKRRIVGFLVLALVGIPWVAFTIVMSTPGSR